MPSDAAVQTLAKHLRGQLLRPGDAGYDEARHIWNGLIDHRPALIAKCADATDVAVAVGFASDHTLALSIRGGGHNIAGTAVCDDGLMIDLSGLRAVHVDPIDRRVRVQPGATWGIVDRATQRDGLIVPGGIVSTTGVAGFTLGGGFGWLTRSWGYTCDNLLSATVVTADSGLVRASADEHPDLFFGLRGGGGNFGVVTEFEFVARPLGPTVVAGLVLHPMARAAEVVSFYRDITTTAPDELTCLMILRTAPLVPYLPASIHGQPVIGIAVCDAGSIAAGERAVRSIKAFGSPVADTIGPMPFVEHQAFLDAGQPAGRHYYWKSVYLRALDETVGQALLEHGGTFTSPYSAVLIMHLGGAAERADRNETAVSNRDAEYIINVQAAWEDGASERHIQWARDFHAALLPSASGAYVNFFTEDEVRDPNRQPYDAAILDRLVAVKRRYDPTNLFRLNKNIVPAPLTRVQPQVSSMPTLADGGA